MARPQHPAAVCWRRDAIPLRHGSRPQSWRLRGGFCGRLFAQCGAEVARVEAAHTRVGADLAWCQNHEDRIDAAIAAWTRPHAKRQAAAKMQAAGVLVDKPPK